jgi:flavonol synthase
LSSGRYKAVIHRSRVHKEKTRMSWATFVEPPRELVVGPHQQLVTDDSPAKHKQPWKYKDYQYRKINLLPL